MLNSEELCEKFKIQTEDNSNLKEDKEILNKEFSMNTN